MKTFRRWKMYLISGVRALRYYSCSISITILLLILVFILFFELKGFFLGGAGFHSLVFWEDGSSVLSLCFSVFIVHTDHLRILLNCSFIFSWCWWGPDIIHFWQAPSHATSSETLNSKVLSSCWKSSAHFAEFLSCFERLRLYVAETPTEPLPYHSYDWQMSPFT